MTYKDKSLDKSFNLLTVPLNTRFRVLTGDYDAYVIDKSGKRYMFCPSKPTGCKIWLITVDYVELTQIGVYQSNMVDSNLENTSSYINSLYKQCKDCSWYNKTNVDACYTEYDEEIAEIDAKFSNIK